ncbi:MAG: hypothetical protein IKE16_09805 [Solobacterium sp.]|nr:hypothetical protein [Solobacterium sp.]
MKRKIKKEYFLNSIRKRRDRPGKSGHPVNDDPIRKKTPASAGDWL